MSKKFNHAAFTEYINCLDVDEYMHSEDMYVIRDMKYNRTHIFSGISNAHDFILSKPLHRRSFFYIYEINTMVSASVLEALQYDMLH